MDRLQRIPIELLYLVVQHLELREVAAVARTCHNLSAKLRRHFYHCIDAPAFKYAARYGRIRTIQGAQHAGVDVSYGLLLPVAIACRQSAFVDFLLQGGWITPDHVRETRQDAYGNRTALSWAAEVGPLSLVGRLMAISGVHANLRDFHQATPLHRAAAHGHLDIMTYLLDHGANLDAKNSGANATPITHACTSNAKEDTKIAVVALLLRRGADAESFDPVRRKTNVCHALDRHHYRLARFLLENGANTEAFRGAIGQALLVTAISQGDDNRVRLLTDYGVGFNEHGPRGLVRYLELAIPRSFTFRVDRTSIMNLLLEKISGQSPPFFERGSCPELDRALRVAITRGQYKLAALLLASGGDMNAADPHGYTPLSIAAAAEPPGSPYGHGLGSPSAYGLARAMLGLGADPLAHPPRQTPSRDVCQDTSALHAAVSRGNIALLKLFAEHGFDITAAHGEGRETTSALHAACVHYQSPVAQYLLEEHGAHPSKRNGRGKAPMHLVAHHGYPELVDLLFKHDAELDAKDDEGSTPLFMACATVHERVARLLLERGADATSSGQQDGITPLHCIAGRWGSLELLDLLIQHGADVCAVTEQAMTPLFEALAAWGEDGTDYAEQSLKIRLLVKHGAVTHLRFMHRLAMLRERAKGTLKGETLT
ncbi:ankyrin repeat-containing domain protein [Emericellopsis atlantica]|uniref:Ankyrin repeat-containing domain protein n=1 Tax=Emericellopsis atlantica TaxID=2614577 RepID=A0A9P7ZLI0_9HYPO|nr:ankyrin repeat-containing domain protein [Emericellopsis atlantica]KAG9253907.1 ankyrin repeat-containing domain protein [Emericellopsis atlantica]